MLKSHIDRKEEALIAEAKAAANSGHPVNKGTSREAFITGFLRNHLASTVDIGTGEIIDANSQPGQSRNQFDVVIYKRNYPKLDFGGGITAFLIESVIATIEVKSTLTSNDLENAIKAAHNAKQLVPNVEWSFRSGHVPPKVLNYVVAYDGPVSMSTVYGWIKSAYQKLEIVQSELSQDAIERGQQSSESIDGVFVLHKGFLYFDNTPISFSTQQHQQQNPTSKWIYANTLNGNLLLLFLQLLGATANHEGKWLNPLPYAQSLSISGIRWGS